MKIIYVVSLAKTCSDSTLTLLHCVYPRFSIMSSHSLHLQTQIHSCALMSPFYLSCVPPCCLAHGFGCKYTAGPGEKPQSLCRDTGGEWQRYKVSLDSDVQSLTCGPVDVVFMLSVQVVYYVFAVFGIWLFEGSIKPPPEMRYGVVQTVSHLFVGKESRNTSLEWKPT